MKITIALIDWSNVYDWFKKLKEIYDITKKNFQILYKKIYPGRQA
jgi:hypothetical protein